MPDEPLREYHCVVKETRTLRLSFSAYGDQDAIATAQAFDYEESDILSVGNEVREVQTIVEAGTDRNVNGFTTAPVKP
jgi:hypothetical protein